MKQGDPLSPILFIIGAEVLSRSLNRLNVEDNFIGYRLPRWSERINHLFYADDTILFYSVDKKSVRRMMQVLRNYENVFGHLINLNKLFLSS